VTVALQELEALELIETNRGVIRTVNRARLEAFANGLYGVPEAEQRAI
jgi:hypothetical protein